jgi:mRNA-degrading endonuclease RelE of RelBE toxin-antitoxin system
MYKLNFLEKAKKDIKKLDKSIQVQIIKKQKKYPLILKFEII